MKILHNLLAKRFYVYALGILVTAALLAGNSVNSPLTSAQSADSIYLTSASGSYAVGSTFTVSIRENSSTQVNAVEADLGYATALLQFVSIDSAGSAFGIDASSTGGNGAVSISRGNTSAVTGDQLVAKVNFKVLASGTATVQMQSSSQALSSTTNTNVVNTRNGSTFTFTSPAQSTNPTPTPPPTPPTPAPTPPAASPGTTPSAAPAPKPATNATVTIAPQGNAQTTNLPGDSQVELSAPATLETTPAGNGEVTKVEYLVNGRLVATVTKPPYSYTVDTTKYRNATYTVTTRTYYKNGKVDSSNASLVVKNPFSLSQLFLQLRHYSWLVVILLLIAGELVYLKFFKNRNYQNPYSNSSGYGNMPNSGTPIDPVATFGPPAAIASSGGAATVQPTPTPVPTQVHTPPPNQGQ